MKRLRVLALVVCLAALASGGLLLARPAGAHPASAGAAATGARSPHLPLLVCQQANHCPSGGAGLGADLAGEGLLAALAAVVATELGRRPWRRSPSRALLPAGISPALLRPPQVLLPR